MATVRFYFDFTSPYTYLASTQLDALAARTSTQFTWVPALLGAVMKTTGNQPPAVLPARAKYMAHDLVRWATHYGVPYVFTPHFPVASIHALRAAIAVQTEHPGAFRPFVDAVFHATWVDGLNIGERAVLGKLAQSVGLDPATVESASDQPRWKDALRQNTDAAIAAGAFGMPAFVLGEGESAELYFGNDRLGLLEARLKRGQPFPAPTNVPTMPAI